MTHEEIVELADAVAPAQGVASGIGQRRTAPSSSSRPPTARRRSRSAARSSPRPPPPPGCRPGRSPPRTRSPRPRTAEDGAAVIRLGSLAGYPFEGPRVLAGLTAPAMPAVFAILYRPDPTKQQYAVMYVGHSEDLSAEPFPFRHPRSPAGSSAPAASGRSSSRPTRSPAGWRRTASRSSEELCAVYQPSCNEQQFDQAWQDHWIGSTTRRPRRPLSTGRQARPVTRGRSGRVADHVVHPGPPRARRRSGGRPAPAGAGRSRRPRSPRPCRRAAAAHRRRHRRRG